MSVVLHFEQPACHLKPHLHASKKSSRSPIAAGRPAGLPPTDNQKTEIV